MVRHLRRRSHMLLGAVVVLSATTLFSLLTFQRVNTLILPDGYDVRVELAETSEARARGLSGRSSLGANEGMLFLFPDRDRHGIWMKDMRFAIDIVWLDGETVVHVVENAPPNDSPARPVYRPLTPANRVLELPAGSAEVHDISQGKQIKKRF